MFEKRDEYNSLCNSVFYIGYIREYLGNIIPNDIIKIIREFSLCFHIISSFNNKTSKICNNINEIKKYLYHRIKFIYFDDYKTMKWDKYWKGNINNFVISKRNHIIIYTDKNELYGCQYMKSKPLLIERKSKDIIVKLCSSYGNAIYLTQNGNVFSIKMPSRNQKLEVIQYEQCISIMDIGFVGDMVFVLNTYNCLYEFDYQKNSKPTKFSDILFRKIKAGLNHVGFITTNNALYMHGSNDWSQCGIDTSMFKAAHMKQIMNEYSIIDINCGDTHTFVLISNGDWYSFGENRNGECLIEPNTNNPYEMISKPTKISDKYIGNGKIIDIIPFGSHSSIIIKLIQ